MMRKGWLKRAAALAFALFTAFAFAACGDGSEGCAHTQTEEVTLISATCTTGGKKKTVCKTCKVVLSEAETEALGHAFGEWEETTRASCSSYGVKQRTCVRSCKETEYIDKKKHTPNADGKCSVCTETVYSLGLKYTVSADESYYSVAMGSATDEDIVIPAEWNDKPVKAIDAEGFAYSQTMKSVTIPESVEMLGSGAFNNSNALETVYWNARACADFSDRNWMFLRGDTAAELRVVFGRNVEHIPARMFFPLYNDADSIVEVKEVTFEEGSKLESIGDYAFYQTPISEITLPDGLKKVGAYAFSKTSLAALRITALAEMGEGAFCNIQSLVSLELGGEVAAFGANAFDYCINLERADLSGLSGTLGASLFKNCYKLAVATFGEGLLCIPERAFYGCTRLQSAVVPDSVTEVGAEAFVGCENVVSVTIGKNVQKIGNSAFSGLTNVRKLYYNATCAEDFESGNGVFLSLGKNTAGVQIVLGENVRRLPTRFLFPSADSGELPKAAKIVLNAALSSIGEYAFFGADCTVVYGGSAAQWQTVTKGEHNDGLANVFFGGGN